MKKLKEKKKNRKKTKKNVRYLYVICACAFIKIHFHCVLVLVLVCFYMPFYLAPRVENQHPTRPNLRVIDLTGNDDAVDNGDNGNNGVEANLVIAPVPDVRDPFQTTDALSNAYDSFRKMRREELTLNNVDDRIVLNTGTAKHRSMMAKIDRHFSDKSVNRIVDPELVRFATSADMTKMNSYDRIRMNLISIEIERNRVYVNKLRLKRKRGRIIMAQPSCPLCLTIYRPGDHVVTPDCGHLACEDCMNEIFDDENLRDSCPSCRIDIEREDLERIYFKFNHDRDAICRYCDTPFREFDDGESCAQFLRCGHVYHKNCWQENDESCVACNNILGERNAKRAFLHFE